MRQPRRRGRQRARDGRQVRGGRRKGHEGGPRVPGPGRGQGARGVPEQGQGPVPLRPGDGRVRARAGGRRGPRRRNARAAGTALAVSFGDAFSPGSLLRPGGLMACADACGHAEPDTVRARPASCVPAGLANRHAGDWWRPPTRGSPAPGPGWPPRGPASAWPTSAARTPSAASWASTWPSSAGGGRRPQAGAPTASPSTPRGRPTPAALPSRPPATTTARPARRSASPASRGATRACPSSSATSPAT